MGEGEIGEMDGKVAITWRHQKRRRLDQRRLRDKSPSETEECADMTERRQFILEK